MMNSPKRVKARALSNQAHMSWPSSSKKKRPTGQKDVEALINYDSNQQEVQPAAVPLNAKGIAAFPDELLLEIMYYLPDIPLPTIEWKPFDADAHIERREALFALSQSCSNLRRFFHPYIWNRIEVVSGMRFLRGGRKSDSTINVEILRQLEVVTIRDPRLAQYVEVINVDVRDYSGNTVLAELARSMGEFPNLHTVKIQVLHGPKSESRWSPKDVFNKYSYPQITSVIIPRRLFSLLRSCPRVRTVDWTTNTSSLSYNSLVSIMAPWCPHLQNLELEFPNWRLEDIATGLPDIRSIRLHIVGPVFGGHELFFSLLSRFRLLNALTIVLHYNIPFELHLLDLAEKLLLDLQRAHREAKQIRVFESTSAFKDGLIEIRNIILPPPASPQAPE